MRAHKPGYRLIFRMWFRHKKTGKIIRTGRPIPMWVKASPQGGDCLPFVKPAIWRAFSRF